jgi:hypothetical protein
MLPFSFQLRDGEPVSDQIVRAAHRALASGELRGGGPVSVGASAGPGVEDLPDHGLQGSRRVEGPRLSGKPSGSGDGGSGTETAASGKAVGHARTSGETLSGRGTGAASGYERDRGAPEKTFQTQ